MQWINNLYQAISSNQFLMAAIGLSGAGIITFWVKDVPRSIYNFFKREFTTTLVITSYNITYYRILKWIREKYKDTNFRNLKITNGRWGDDVSVTSIGYGVHWIKFNKKFFLLTLVKEASAQADRDKESMTITIFGRDRKVFDDLVKEVETLDIDNRRTKIYRMQDYWSYIKDQPKRDINSVFIEREKKDLLIDNLTRFKEQEQWYLRHGIPYQFGILLYGPPGTGKTSLIKAIAGYLNYPIYYLSPDKLASIDKAMSSLQDKCIVVIEDIDSSCSTHRRDSKPKSVIEPADSPESNYMKEISLMSLSDILNSLDGIFSVHGRILIATTNHIEALDPALIRPGRIDLKVEIGYVNHEILGDFLRNFFPGIEIDISGISLKPGVSVADLQSIVLQGGKEEDILISVMKEE